MGKQKREKPRPTRPKGQRWPETPEERTAYYDELERLECEEIEHDHEMAKWKKSADYAARKNLAEQFAKRNKK